MTDSEHIAAEAAYLTAQDAAQERIRALQSELERIRPVYEAACAWRDKEPLLPAEIVDAVDLARSPR